MHSIQIEHPFDADYPIIIPLKLNRVTGYFEVRTPMQENYKKQDILMIDLTAEAPL